MDTETRRGLLPTVRARLEGETTAFAGRCLQTLTEHWDDWFGATAR
jgi:hypothetical protein